MKTRYHIEITRNALGDQFAENPLKTILQANIRQDKINNQFGHDFIHFDGSAFKASYAYINQQEEICLLGVRDQDYQRAQKALGRLLHTWQDFYSHSNYVSLWIDKNRNSKPEDIVIDDLEILKNPRLKSGKNYGLLEFACMLPFISRLIKPFMPDDSHARMNMDSPAANPLFPYAYQAAEKKTHAVFEQIMQQLTKYQINPENIEDFLGKSL